MPGRRPPLVECANPDCPRRARSWARTWFCSNACRQAGRGSLGNVREQQRAAAEFFRVMADKQAGPG